LITKEQILTLSASLLKDSSLFVTGVKIGADNHISVYIDGDKGVTIQDCVQLSRAIEESLDRSKEDFSLDVSSHGAATPLVLPRQYPRHVGREFEIRLNDGSRAEGRLVHCDEEGLKIEYDVRENKPVGKGKITVNKQQLIPYSAIKESKIKLKY
jgi:ribosome maturation factor RimP